MEKPKVYHLENNKFEIRFPKPIKVSDNSFITLGTNRIEAVLDKKERFIVAVRGDASTLLDHLRFLRVNEEAIKEFEEAMK